MDSIEELQKELTEKIEDKNQREFIEYNEKRDYILTDDGCRVCGHPFWIHKNQHMNSLTNRMRTSIHSRCRCGLSNYRSAVSELNCSICGDLLRRTYYDNGSGYGYDRSSAFIFDKKEHETTLDNPVCLDCLNTPNLELILEIRNEKEELRETANIKYEVRQVEFAESKLEDVKNKLEEEKQKVVEIAKSLKGKITKLYDSSKQTVNASYLNRNL